MKKKVNVTCDLCSCSFKSLRGMNMHMRRAHQDAEAPPPKAAAQRAPKETGFSLGLFLEALKSCYAADPCSPGVLVSKITSGEFYVAIHRYHAAFGEKKQVVLSVKDRNLKTAIRTLALRWVNDPVHELLRTLREDNLDPKANAL